MNPVIVGDVLTAVLPLVNEALGRLRGFVEAREEPEWRITPLQVGGTMQLPSCAVGRQDHHGAGYVLRLRGGATVFLCASCAYTFAKDKC